MRFAPEAAALVEGVVLARALIVACGASAARVGGSSGSSNSPGSRGSGRNGKRSGGCVTGAVVGKGSGSGGRSPFGKRTVAGQEQQQQESQEQQRGSQRRPWHGQRHWRQGGD